MSARVAASREIVAFMDDPDTSKPNVIHSTDGARGYGYAGALIGGVTAYGWTVGTIVSALGAGWLDHGWVSLAFKRPMYPGDRLQVTVDPPGALVVRRGDEVCFEGNVGLGVAPWFSELELPQAQTARPRPATLPALTLENAPVGRDLASMEVRLTPADAAAFARDSEHETLDCFFGDRPRVHPAWLAEQPIRLLHHSYDYGPSIHTESRIQHLSPVFAGPRFVVTGKCTHAFERNRHHYIANDCVIADEAGNALVRLRHTSIFRVAARHPSA